MLIICGVSATLSSVLCPLCAVLTVLVCLNRSPDYLLGSALEPAGVCGVKEFGLGSFSLSLWTGFGHEKKLP